MELPFNQMNTYKMKLTHLNHFGIVKISGADAESFLQRQFTNDISELTTERCSYSAYLNPKGRIIANFMIFIRKDSFYLALSEDLIESFVRRLKMFVIRDKVDISIESDMQMIGLLDDELSAMIFPTPVETFQVLTEDDLTFIRIPGEPKRVVIIGNKQTFERYSDQFDDGLIDEWKRLDIMSMNPLVNSLTTEQLVLQAVNLDLTGAVSFTKGCYPGQEIVARLHYKGGVNRRMFQAQVAGAASPEPGTLVYCDDLPGNQTGTVITSTDSKEDTDKHLLISLPLKFLRQNNLRLDDGTKVELLLGSMPYAIPEFETQ